MATYRQERVACGKKTCGTCAGVRLAHGPYWYAYWHPVNKFGLKLATVRKRYMGKDWRESWGQERRGDPPPETVKASTSSAARASLPKTRSAPATLPKRVKRARSARVGRRS